MIRYGYLRNEIKGIVLPEIRAREISLISTGVPKVKIEIGHRRISGLAHGFNILYHRGTDMGHQLTLSDVDH